MTKSTLFAALALSATALVGCAVESTDGTDDGGDDSTTDGTGGDDGDDGVDPNPPGDGDVAAYFNALGHRDCDDAFACKTSFPTEEGSFEEYFGTSASQCYSDAAEYYDVAAISASISAGKIHFDASAASTCIAGLAPANCSTYWTEGPNIPAACDNVMEGTVANGGACSNDFECQSLESICGTSNTCVADTGQ